ncbi:MAG TPA: maleylpyruvate isomerase family mycothiol-dependent enzyme, partial [Acidimicrobiia bacterium]|nr:maleylpyruvate isomerase family mycothiol-dependent enzyme [Acidimicrobiia bacterium]
MSLSRTEVVAGTADELAGFEALVRSIDDAGWGSPTRCQGWSVADVCAHVVGTIADIAAGRLQELVSPDSPARQVAERAGHSQDQMADELQAAAKVTADIGASFDDTAWAGPAPVDLP